MLADKLTVVFASLLLLGAAACGGGEEGAEAIDADDAGVGQDAGFEVLVDTAATPAGGAPGMNAGAGGDTAAGAPR